MRLYDGRMPGNLSATRAKSILKAALLEIAFIVFLFYANLLMGEFTVSNGHGKSLTMALRDLLSAKSLITALVSAVIGFAGIQYLRRNI